MKYLAYILAFLFSSAAVAVFFFSCAMYLSYGDKALDMLPQILQ